MKKIIILIGICILLVSQIVNAYGGYISIPKDANEWQTYEDTPVVDSVKHTNSTHGLMDGLVYYESFDNFRFEFYCYNKILDFQVSESVSVEDAVRIISTVLYRHGCLSNGIPDMFDEVIFLNTSITIRDTDEFLELWTNGLK